MPGREDDVKDALPAAPIREHINKLAIAERLPADMVGQERDAKAGSRSHAHGSEIAAAHAWFVAHYLAHAVLALKVPLDLPRIVACAQRGERTKDPMRNKRIGTM